MPKSMQLSAQGYKYLKFTVLGGGRLKITLSNSGKNDWIK